MRHCLAARVGYRNREEKVIASTSVLHCSVSRHAPPVATFAAREAPEGLGLPKVGHVTDPT